MNTFGTLINDPVADALLSPYAEIFGRALHYVFRELCVKGRALAELKKEVCARFGLTSRHFNGIRYEAQQAAETWKGTTEYQISVKEDRIESLERVIKRAQSKRAILLERSAKAGLMSAPEKKKKKTLERTLHYKKRKLIGMVRVIVIQQDHGRHAKTPIKGL